MQPFEFITFSGEETILSDTMKTINKEKVYLSKLPSHIDFGNWKGNQMIQACLLIKEWKIKRIWTSIPSS